VDRPTGTLGGDVTDRDAKNYLSIIEKGVLEAKLGFLYGSGICEWSLFSV
jgi:hypothetical protein